MLKKLSAVGLLVVTLSACGDAGPGKKTVSNTSNNTTPTGCIPACEGNFTCVGTTCVEQMDPEDCEEGEEYNDRLQVCLTPSCDNGIKDMAEEGPDCGGPCADCTTAATCTDGIQNGSETGVDCGGSCAACTVPEDCGDGTQQAEEDCDHGGTVQLACAYGESSCMVCNAQCQLIPGQVIGYCGDGTTQAAGGEQCDHAGTPQTTCAYGQMSCTVCDSDCKNVAGIPGGYCGDGTKQANEACDHGGTPTTQCVYGQMSCTVCNSQCQSVAGTTQYCGDGVRQGTEQCDGSQLNGATCASLNAGTGTLSCSNNCTYNTATCTTTNTDFVVEVSTGYSHTCARMSDNTARCWGRNSDGRLGDGTTTLRNRPVTVMGLTNIAQISAGGYHTCARRVDGTVWCWGSNQHGQLGIGTSGGSSSSPVQVLGLSGVTTLSAGTSHSCAVTPIGTYCWGAGTAGQLGHGDVNSMLSPSSSVATSSTIVQVSAGVMHTCARYSGGNLACWGRDTVGELGSFNYTGSGSSSPVDVFNSNGSILNAGYVGVGSEFSCSRSGTSVYCWGDNMHFQLATTTVLSSMTPVLIPGTYSFLSVGERHACGLSSGSVYCWGRNAFGRLGIGNTMNQYTPSLVNLVGAADVQAGGTHTCARMTSGQVSCWGRNTDGQLGNGSQTDSFVPVNVVF